MNRGATNDESNRGTARSDQLRIPRFWYPRHDEAALEEDGFLADPLGEYAGYQNSHASTLEDLARFPIVVLLGEPGMGKTTELTAEENRLAGMRRTSVVVLARNLREYEGFADLKASLFEGQEFTDWRRGEHSIVLLLDSLDEALAQSAPLAERLCREIASIAGDPLLRDRFFVRIACRTAIWPETATSLLVSAWGTEPVKIVSLAPLRRTDVVPLLGIFGVSQGDETLGKILDRGLSALAARPISLRLLASISPTGLANLTQVTLYEAGCRSLAAEANSRRELARYSGNLSANERLAVASRIAACVVFGNRFVTYFSRATSSKWHEKVAPGIDVDALVGGSELSESVESLSYERSKRVVSVSEGNIALTLQSALFTVHNPAGSESQPDSPNGTLAFAFSHWSFAEYLAARWAVMNRLSTAQMIQLVFVKSRGGLRIAPQLRQTAAWLCSLKLDFRRIVLQNDPTVLLRSDVSIIGDEERASLVSGILDLARRDKLDHNVFAMTTEFSALSNAAIVTQLVSVFESESEPPAARSLALRIAAAVGRSEFFDAALGLALHANTSPRIRVDAIRVVGSGARAGEILRLRPLLEEISDEVINGTVDVHSGVETLRITDSDDQVRGAVLSLLWPKHMSLRELLQFVIQPKQDSFYGIYKHFLSGVTSWLSSRALAPDDIVAACEWLSSIAMQTSGDVRSRLGVVERFEEAIWHACWRGVRSFGETGDTEGLIARLATVAADRVLKFEPIAHGDGELLIKEALSSPQRRCTYLVSIIRTLSEASATDDAGVTGLSVLRLRIVGAVDVPSLISALHSAAESGESKLVLSLASTLAAFASTHGGESFELVYAEAFMTKLKSGGKTAVSVALAEALAWWIGPIDLDSPEAERARKQQGQIDDLDARRRALENERMAGAREREAKIGEEVAKSVEMLLTGEIDSWWRFNYLVSISAGGVVEDWFSQFAGRPQWERLSAEVRARLVDKAREYVESRGDKHVSWRASGSPDRPALAGVRALMLLKEAAPEQFESLDRAVFDNWAAAIVAFPQVGDALDGALHTQLIADAFLKSPTAVASAVCDTAAFEDSRFGSTFILDRILEQKEVWTRADSAPLVTALLELVEQSRLEAASGLSIAGLVGIIGFSLRFGAVHARSFAEQLVRSRRLEDDSPEVARKSTELRRGAFVRADSAPPAARSRSDLAIAAAQALAQNTPDAGWNVVWPALVESEGFAHDVLLGIASSRSMGRSEPIARKLDEAQLAELFIFISRLFPVTEDPEAQGFVGPRHEVSWLRDGLLEELTKRGTDDAVSAVQTIVKEFPERADLSYSLRNAELALSRASWRPTPPDVLLSLAHENGRTIIASERDLADAVQASILRFASGLRGVDATVGQYWDQLGEGRWKPKNEEALSNALTHHLRRDLDPVAGATTAREVRIRPPMGTTPSENVDILVQAQVAGNGQQTRMVQVIIEIKGQWNRGLKSAIRTQLVERYLDKNDQTLTGIFLVGWYTSDEWDGDDYRNSAAKRNGSSRLVLEQELQAAAAHLTNARRDVRAMVIDLSLRNHAADSQ